MADDDTPQDGPKAAGKPQPLIRLVSVSGKPPGAKGLSIQPQRMESSPSAAESGPIRSVQIEAKQPVSRAPRLFETVRVIDLSRFRQSLRRQRSMAERKGTDFMAEAPHLARLAIKLDDLYDGSTTTWPDVVVVRRPASDVIETNYALIGSTIYLGAHLSTDWTEGREGIRFHETLLQALTEWQRAHHSQFEPLGVRSGPDPDTQG